MMLLLKKKRATAWIATQFDCLQILSLLLNMQLLQCYIFVLFSVSLTWQQRRRRKETEDSVSASLVLGADGTPERPLIASNHFQLKAGLACCSRLNCLLCKLRLIMGRRFLAGNWMHAYMGGVWRSSQENAYSFGFKGKLGCREHDDCLNDILIKQKGMDYHCHVVIKTFYVAR